LNLNNCLKRIGFYTQFSKLPFQGLTALIGPFLPFEDGYFDAVVSNLVFHEVNDAKDKRELIREALRVVKKGGKFAFQDLFLERHLYGETDDLLRTIKGWGINKVEFVKTCDKPFIPTALKLPFMVGTIGIMYGEK
jgi:SAM-dependent methyltransferase